MLDTKVPLSLTGLRNIRFKCEHVLMRGRRYFVGESSLERVSRLYLPIWCRGICIDPLLVLLPGGVMQVELKQARDVLLFRRSIFERDVDQNIDVASLQGLIEIVSRISFRRVHGHLQRIVNLYDIAHLVMNIAI